MLADYQNGAFAPLAARTTYSLYADRFSTFQACNPPFVCCFSKGAATSHTYLRSTPCGNLICYAPCLVAM